LGLFLKNKKSNLDSKDIGVLQSNHRSCAHQHKRTFWKATMISTQTRFFKYFFMFTFHQVKLQFFAPSPVHAMNLDFRKGFLLGDRSTSNNSNLICWNNELSKIG